MIIGVCCIVAFIARFLWTRIWASAHTIIDNPTDQAISFELDGKEYILEPHTSEKISLKGGKHTLVYSGQTTHFEKKSFSLSDLWKDEIDYSIINPTESVYIFYNEIYISGNMSDEEIEKVLPKYECVDEEGNPDTCTEKYLNEVFIQEKVNYGLDEQLPETTSMSRWSKYALRSKLFRAADYLDYLEEE